MVTTLSLKENTHTATQRNNGFLLMLLRDLDDFTLQFFQFLFHLIYGFLASEMLEVDGTSLGKHVWRVSTCCDCSKKLTWQFNDIYCRISEMEHTYCPKKGFAASDIDCTGWLDSHDLNTVPTNDQPITYTKWTGIISCWDSLQSLLSMSDCWMCSSVMNYENIHTELPCPP